MRLQALAAVAALAGLGVSIYLTVVHYSGVPLACPANAVVNCEAVLSSRYAVIAGSGVPTSVAGIAWFAVSAAIALAVLAGRLHHRAQLAWAAVGMVTVLYLVYVEIVQLGAVCIWCSVAHVLVLVIFLVALPRARIDRVGP